MLRHRPIPVKGVAWSRALVAPTDRTCRGREEGEMVHASICALPEDAMIRTSLDLTSRTISSNPGCCGVCRDMLTILAPARVLGICATYKSPAMIPETLPFPDRPSTLIDRIRARFATPYFAPAITPATCVPGRRGRMMDQRSMVTPSITTHTHTMA